MFRKVLIILLMVVCVFSFTASAYTLDDIEWKSTETNTLHWGHSFENGEAKDDSYDTYVIKVEDFSVDGFASISISRDDQIKTVGFISNGQSFEYRDEEGGQDIKVFASELKLNIDPWTGNMEDPTVKLEIWRRGVPEFDIDIDTEKDEYDPRSPSDPNEVVTTITIKNDGYAEANDVEIIISPASMELADGKLKYNLFTLAKDEIAEPIEVSLEIPHLWEETDLDINVTVRAKDINGDIHEDSEKKTITVQPKAELILTKSIAEELYMDETAYVTVAVRNYGIYSMNSVTIKDTVLSSMELKDSITLEKTVSFKPGETIEVFSYSLKPIKPGSYTSPEAIATFEAPDGKTYTYESEDSKIEINGPYIALTQKLDKTKVEPGTEIKVTVTAKNEGNRDASTRVSSTDFPEGTSFVSGETTFDKVLGKGESGSYSYILKMNDEGTFKLPPATATFIDMESYKGEKISNMPEITVEIPEPEESSTSSGTSNPSNDGSSQPGTESNEEVVEPGFESIFAITALAGVYLAIRRRK
ncbi:conserved repeat domain-containing protein [Methanococcoides vulcani]|uniref:Conserved repeat domain-containing protein n=1 Tax=Methanococcoides vulcani TaxID=1353158 RepID=A0A1I0AJC1_9EURY|nr:BatD family protein [Methanococcoides vulcani]SES93371.1 conserved repeat domain-containing protein [Methanococcoides vulcani]